MPELTVEAAAGVYQQPPAYPISLPGADTFGLRLGLQRSTQASLEIAARLPAGFTLKATGYYQTFSNIIDFYSSSDCLPGDQHIASNVTRVDGAAYGLELFVRREIGPVSGWIAYTLSRSERNYACGVLPSDFDQTHVLNVVVQARLPWRIVAGAHLYVATGRPYDTPFRLDPLRRRRLPTYAQLDVRLDREWVFRRWACAVFLEVLNATFSRMPTTTSFVGGGNYAVQGFSWILPSLGLRARF